jgi:hypothetical protein
MCGPGKKSGSEMALTAAEVDSVIKGMNDVFRRSYKDVDLRQKQNILSLSCAAPLHAALVDFGDIKSIVDSIVSIFWEVIIKNDGVIEKVREIGIEQSLVKAAQTYASSSIPGIAKMCLEELGFKSLADSIGTPFQYLTISLRRLYDAVMQLLSFCTRPIVSVSPSAKISRAVHKSTNSPSRKRSSRLSNELEGYFVHMLMSHGLFLSEAFSLFPFPFHPTFIAAEAPSLESVTITAAEPTVLDSQRASRQKSPAKFDRVPALPMSKAAQSAGGYLCTYINVFIPCIYLALLESCVSLFWNVDRSRTAEEYEDTCAVRTNQANRTSGSCRE